MANPTVVPTSLYTQLYGEDAFFGRLWGGPMASYASVTASGQVGTAGNRVLYGVACIAAGTLAGIYDSTSATGQLLIPSTAMTQGQIITFGGIGVKAITGLYASWTSGSFVVLYL